MRRKKLNAMARLIVRVGLNDSFRAFLHHTKTSTISGLITVNEPLTEFLPAARYLSQRRRSRSGFGKLSLQTDFYRILQRSCSKTYLTLLRLVLMHFIWAFESFSLGVKVHFLALVPWWPPSLSWSLALVILNYYSLDRTILSIVP